MRSSAAFHNSGFKDFSIADAQILELVEKLGKRYSVPPLGKTEYRYRNTIGELLLVFDVGFTESPGHVTPDEVFEQAQFGIGMVYHWC